MRKVVVLCAAAGVLLVGGHSAGAGALHAGLAGLPSERPTIAAPAKDASRLAGQLIDVASVARAHGATAAAATAARAGLDVNGGRVRVIVAADSADAGQAATRAAGGSVEATAGRLVQARVPVTGLTGLSKARGVVQVRSPLTPVPQDVAGEGPTATHADVWHAANLNGSSSGTPVKVAIIDISFAGYAGLLGTDLPALSNVTTVDDCSGNLNAGDGHGTAVAEVVHDMAPDAQLYLICVDSEVTLAQAEQYVVTNHIPIVNHSVGWFGDMPGDGTGGAGTPDAIVADARSHGVLWVNAGGNSATTHWRGTWNDPDSNGILNFSGADEGNTILAQPGDELCAELRWNAWPVTAQDYDLYLVRSSDDTVVADSITDQAGSPSAPVEMTCYPTTDSSPTPYAWVIARFGSGGFSNPTFDLFSFAQGSSLEYETAATSIVDPAASPAAFAVGAVCWQTPNASPEPYSSQGPTVDGRTKPDLVAPDSVSTATFGPSGTCGADGFAGTSAAAPQVAGAAALLLSKYPSATADQLDWLLRSEVPAAEQTSDSVGAGTLWFHPPVTGGPVAYTSFGSVFVSNADGTQPDNLGGTQPSTPVLSPDGTKIA